MGRHPTERKMPDLFSTATVGDASAPPKLPAAEATTESATQRHVLPKNHRHAIEQLSDGELDELLEMAFDAEKRRRGLRWSIGRDVTPSSSRRPLELLKKQSPPTTKRRRVDIAEVPLTRGQVNAVRAAFKAGITPLRIARQFGISQSNVRKALASDEPRR